jgi:hypothetical protein
MLLQKYSLQDKTQRIIGVREEWQLKKEGQI